MKFPLSLFLNASLLFLNCGTGSEVDSRHFAIEGRAVYADNVPVVGALVRVRPQGFLSFRSGTGFGLDTVTDNYGYFHFDTIPADSYTVEINKEGKFGALQTFEINQFDSFPFLLSEVTLVPTGIITGCINLPISDDTVRPYVALYNVDYFQKMPLTQDFRFEGIPQGIYSLQIVPYIKSKLLVELHDIRVLGDSVTDVGILIFTLQPFFNGCTSFECDSMAVRSILDANGRTDISVVTVVEKDQLTGRVSGLDLNSRSIFTITKDIGSLSALKTLDLRNNRIQSIPGQIGYLRALRECYLDSNELYDIPPELSYLSSLNVLTVSHNKLYRIDSRLLKMTLSRFDLSFNNLDLLPEVKDILPGIDYFYLNDNNLVWLPGALQYLSPTDFTIGNNRLCSISSTLSQWLFLHDEDWFDSQRCPGSSIPE